MEENKRRRRRRPRLSYLHEDIMVEIMSRVPAKSLLRFKSVCKHWKSIIGDPKFVTLHHNRSHSRSDGGNLVISILIPKEDFFKNKRSKKYAYYYDVRFFSAPYQGGAVVPLLKYYLPRLHRYEAAPSTHGLILLFPTTCFYQTTCFTNQPIFVFNPTTRQLVRLPLLENYVKKLEKRRSENPRDNNICLQVHGYSLGFDPLTGVYKVLSRCTVVRFEDGRYPWERIGSTMYYAFTLGTKSKWRKLGTPQLPSHKLDRDSVCVNGAIYFKADDHYVTRDKIHDFIVAFNVGEEKFCLVSLPQQAPPFKWLTELGGRLALCRHTKDNTVVVLILEDMDQDKYWNRVELEEPLEWIHENQPYTLVGGVESSNKFLFATLHLRDSKHLRVYYCNQSGKEWSKSRVTGLPDVKNLRPSEFLMTNNIETLFSLA